MAAAIVPIAELALTEIPVLVPEFLKIIKSIGQVIHKPAGSTFTPAQIQATQTAALALAKPVVASVLPGSAATITDAQISAFLEALYQMQKSAAAPETPAAAMPGASLSQWMALTTQLLAIAK